MARKYKDYYGSNNKKAKDGANIFFAMVKGSIWLITIIFAGLVDFSVWTYNKYKDRKKVK